MAVPCVHACGNGNDQSSKQGEREREREQGSGYVVAVDGDLETDGSAVVHEVFGVEVIDWVQAVLL
jgi:hypothetical protein